MAAALLVATAAGLLVLLRLRGARFCVLGSSLLDHGGLILFPLIYWRIYVEGRVCVPKMWDLGVSG